MKKCKFCAEEIQEDAVKCKHCKSDLVSSVSSTPSEQPSPDVTVANKKPILVKKSAGCFQLGCVGLIVFIAIIIMVSAFSVDEAANRTTTQNNQVTANTPTDFAKSIPLEELEVLFDVKDFNKKSISSIKEKYGEPISESTSAAPVYSHATFEKSGYAADVQYLSSDPRTFSVTITAVEGKCEDPLKPIPTNEVIRVLKTLNTEYDAQKLGTKTKNGKTVAHRVAKDYYGWEEVRIMCSLGKDTVFSFHSYGWENR